jgi:putative FmdB family regulatory protein
VPTYQYACKECDHQFEAVQSFSDASLTDCPECSGRLRKLFGSVGVIFKGSGFYRTDSRSGSNGKSGGNGAAKSNGSSNGSASASGDSGASDKSASSSSSKATASASSSTSS